MRRIYLDNAATTAVSPAVMAAMLPYFTEVYGNASSIHGFGREAKRAIENARRQVMKALHAAAPQEIYFTAGGSESDNWAIKGVALAHQGGHIITTAIEHHAVLHTCQWLEKQGYDVTYLPVDEYGRVTAAQVEKAIKPDTILVSVMAANNEVGTIQPIAEIGKLCRERGVLFHTDAVQAIGAIPIDVQAMNIDMLSISGHKFHAPKGVGVLYVRRGTRFRPYLKGGHQERGRRAGTENVPYIIGLGKACELAGAKIEEERTQVAAMRDRLQAGLLASIPNAKVNGDEAHRLPNTVNISFEAVEGEALLLQMDQYKICASSGSACTSGSLEPSHVLRAMGVPFNYAHGSVRFSLCRYNTEAEVDSVLEVMPKIVHDLREISPFAAFLKK